ncbi:MAG: hypothetical protein PHF60_00915 [Candidatus ainarchaeum sp.]|nr:hypothetical protein [Candidatus ainarchaeum sp.]
MRYHHGKRSYTLTDGKSEYEFYTDESVEQGACLSLQGEMGVGSIAASRVAVLTGDKEKEARERVIANIKSSMFFPDRPELVDDDAMKKLWPRLMEAALEIVCAKKLGRSVLLRFHGDADGIAGAFALTGIINCKALQHNSAMYGARDALRDMAMIGQESRPFVILLDFGSADGCKEGLGLLSAAGIDYLVIDHHPYTTRNARVVNPFSVADGASKYTAGYLAAEIAITCGMDKEKALGLAKIACSGDKSSILASDEADAKKAMVLDFLASHVSFGNNLDFYRRVMEKNELFDSIAQQADESIGEAAQKAIAREKRTKEGQLEICVFSLEGIHRKGEWPPSSKITTRVFDNMRSAGNALLCIGHTDRSLIIRLNDEAVALGLSANGMAESIKKSMADFVEGGGGHVKAGAIRAKKGFVKDVLGELLREAGRIARKDY